MPKAKATTLLRRDLTDDEQRETLDEVRRAIDGLRESLAAGRFRVVGQVPSEADVLGRVVR